MTNKNEIRKLIIRMLLNERELSGYDIWKELSMKGVKIKTNYLYMILGAMNEDEGLLKARWVDNPKGPRRHLFSLSKGGMDEFQSQLKEALDFIMSSFVHANLTSNDIPDHVALVKGLFNSVGAPPPRRGSNFVLTTPSFDPLICYPISFYVLSEALPDVSISVVKTPGTALYGESPRNMTFLDGRRHDMPLKDDFADYLLVEGFPRGASEEETISECFRVLKKKGGHLIIRVPNVMTVEKRPKFSTLSEFASKLFYDFSGQDRIISVEMVKQLLHKRSVRVEQKELRGNVVFYAEAGRPVKLLAQTLEIPQGNKNLRKPS